MSVQILQGDCRDVLATLPDASVHCCVTSPPYWGLRDYGVAGQIGLEPTIEQFVAEMVAVFREVRRVLRPDGTLWLNLGDSYATGGGAGWQGKNGQRADRRFTAPELKPQASEIGLKPKDLCGIPWRVAFALQDDGWYLRQDIIWHKPNPMPESVTDRCTKAHEYIFLLSKGPKYFYDAEAIKEEFTGNAPGAKALKQNSDRNDGGRVCGRPESGVRNKRSVWTVATAPFSEAHFATFPPDLIEPCIQAGTSEKGCCAKCGAPWGRISGRAAPARDVESSTLDRYGTGDSGVHRKIGSVYQKWLDDNPKQTISWQPTCKCDAPTVPCAVLDPFGGAGTTGLVADRLQRNAILVELNPTYAEMAKLRIHGDAPLFAEAL
jgi:DNA modification methylase